jgi:hypothetical protein
MKYHILLGSGEYHMDVALWNARTTTLLQRFSSLSLRVPEHGRHVVQLGENCLKKFLIVIMYDDSVVAIDYDAPESLPLQIVRRAIDIRLLNPGLLCTVTEIENKLEVAMWEVGTWDSRGRIYCEHYRFSRDLLITWWRDGVFLTLDSQGAVLHSWNLRHAPEQLVAVEMVSGGVVVLLDTNSIVSGTLSFPPSLPPFASISLIIGSVEHRDGQVRAKDHADRRYTSHALCCARKGTLPRHTRQHGSTFAASSVDPPLTARVETRFV